MKRLSILAICSLCLSLIGCNYPVTSESIHAGVEQCSTNGGVRVMYAYEDGVQVNCNNGAIFHIDHSGKVIP